MKRNLFKEALENARLKSRYKNLNGFDLEKFTQELISLAESTRKHEVKQDVKDNSNITGNNKSLS